MMKPSIINEAFFWKHLADSLLSYSNINKEEFYEKIRHIKSVWDVQDIHKLNEDINLAAKSKTDYIKKNFLKIINEIKE